MTSRGTHGRDDGYAMAALLVGMTIMALVMSIALPAWRTEAQREKEAELIFRGQQYARAIVLFQRKYANTFPPNVDILLNEHYLRKKYKDPITNDDFQVIYANQQQSAQPSAGGAQGGAAQSGTVPTQGQQVRPPSQTVGAGAPFGPQGGIIGVTSKSTAQSLRIYNGHEHYNEWVFVAQQASSRAGAPTGSQTPTGGVNVPGGAPGGIGGRGNQPGQGGRGNQPPGQRGNQPPPFGQRPGGFGQPGGGFGQPGGGFGQGGFQPLPGHNGGQ